MEINSNSQYTNPQSRVAKKKVDEQKLETFGNYIDKSRIVESNKLNINEDKNIENGKQFIYTYENYPYYFNHEELKLESFTLYLFNIEQSKLPWEEQLIVPMRGLGEESIYQENQKWAKENDPLVYEWNVHTRDATNGNKYDDAPEFEAFVKKWMNKGESEETAKFRAQMYAQVGLLDYGKQKAVIIEAELPVEDIRQHGMWLIDNPPLRQAMLKTLDDVDSNDASDLIDNIFYGGVEHQHDDFKFEDLLKQYGVKLEDLKSRNPDSQDDKYTFTRDINLRNDSSPESIEYNNFIFDTLLGYFKERIESVNQSERVHNEDFSDAKKAINTLIDNFNTKINQNN
jgi:hypothetical protein